MSIRANCEIGKLLVSLICLVGIHPIVILTISDFYNRMRVTSKGSVKRVYGALLGQKIGSKVEIFSAFEFVNQSIDEKNTDFDLAYIDTRRDLATQLFPKLDIIGFFSTNTTSKPNEIDTQMLKTLKYFGVITPVYLVLSTDVGKATELPIETYETDYTNNVFNKVNHIVEGWESERICLDTVIKSSDVQSNESGFIKNYKTTKNALNVLKEILELIKENISNPKFKKDQIFQAMVDELIINYPDLEGTDYPGLINLKKKELFVLNNLCASSLGRSFQGKGELLKMSIPSNQHEQNQEDDRFNKMEEMEQELESDDSDKRKAF